MTTAVVRRPVRLFISFAERDWSDVSALLDLLKPQLAISRRIDPVLWASHPDLRTGDDFQAEIFHRIATCDYALWMVSPSFLSSQFIRDHEIPPFVGPSRRVPGLPVGLHPVPLDGTADLQGIEALEIFKLNKAKWFSQCRTAAERREFCAALAAQLRSVIDPPSTTW